MMARNECSLPQWNSTHGGRAELRPRSAPGRLGSDFIRSSNLVVYSVTSLPSRVVSNVSFSESVADWPPWKRNSGALRPLLWPAFHEFDLLTVSSDGLNRQSMRSPRSVFRYALAGPVIRTPPRSVRRAARSAAAAAAPADRRAGRCP